MESANRTRNLELVRSDARFEQEKKPRQEEINHLFDSRENIEDMLRFVGTWLKEYRLSPDLRTELNDVHNHLKYELSQLGG